MVVGTHGVTEKGLRSHSVLGRNRSPPHEEQQNQERESSRTMSEDEPSSVHRDSQSLVCSVGTEQGEWSSFPPWFARSEGSPEAKHRRLTEDDGEFTVHQETEFPKATIQASTESLLMEGCRLLDENRR